MSGSDPFEPEGKNLPDQFISGESAIRGIPPFEGIEDREKDDGGQGRIEVWPQGPVLGSGPQNLPESLLITVASRQDFGPVALLQGVGLV